MAKATTEQSPDVVLALAALREARDVDVTAQLAVLVEAAAVAVAAQGALVGLGEEREALEAEIASARAELSNVEANIIAGREAQAESAARSTERVRELESVVELARGELMALQGLTAAEEAKLKALQAEGERLRARYTAAIGTPA